LLCEHGIEPDVFVSCEAKPRLENVQRKNERTLYLLSSRCSPELYDWLEDRKIVIWHPYVETGIHPELSGRHLIGGGTTSGLRAITLAYVMGFSKFVLYGYDSCLDLKTKKKRYDSGSMNPEQWQDRIIRGRRFICNAAMAMQADEVQEYYKICPELSLDVKGDGLLAAVIAERRRMGLRA